MPARLRVVANHYFASEGLLKEPFPDPKHASPRDVSVPLPVGEGGRRGDPGEANPPELLEVVEEAQRLLADFIGSEAWEEIKDSEIIGREMPFFYTTNEGPLMRGTIDILYRLPSKQLVIGDYKSDKELDTSKYTEQGKAYEEAVSRALGEKPIFKLIHLREGSAVSL
jgi:ATP-dependent exoDNAse (exonuclease V) beta subunit